MANIRIKPSCWDAHQDALSNIRQQVFIQEQSVPVHLEWDDADPSALHWLVLANNQPVGCARITIDAAQPHVANLGRVAILHGHRRNGLGSLLLQILEQQAPLLLQQRGHTCTRLTAAVQCAAMGFYAANGWHVETQGDAASPSEPTLPHFHWDAEIPHTPMSRVIGQRVIERSISPDSPDDLATRLKIGQDSNRYRWSIGNTACTTGLLQVILSQNPPRLAISVHNLNDPMWEHPTTQQCFRDYLQRSLNKEVRILIQPSDRAIHDHPLVQLSQQHDRLAIRLNTATTLTTSQILTWPTVDMSWTDHSGQISVNDQLACEQQTATYNLAWHQSSQLDHSKRTSP